jgi:hypothetical protein
MEALELKDIHLPETIGWWPPAPGWWLVPLALILLVMALRYLYRRLTRNSAVKRAKKLLVQLRQQSLEPGQCLSELSILLRRTAISLESRPLVAGLHGQAWLDYLDKNLPDAPFSQGVGRYLADAHYRPVIQDDIDLNALFTLCERWLKQQGKRA